jgi:hypothetical protein
MLKLDASQSSKVFGRYKSGQFFFPLIGAVLNGQQDGNVYADSVDLNQVYVEHDFGFSQIFGRPTADFEKELHRYLCIEMRFTAPKVRLYGTYVPDFLAVPEYESIRSYRQRFAIDRSGFRGTDLALAEKHGLKTGAVGPENVSEVERTFGVVTRFWRTEADFVEHANAVVVYHRDQMAGICYAAAEADGRIEIDVFTLPEFRYLGVGKCAVSRFVENCFEKELQPLWDCFTNNAGSMNLSRSMGFTAAGDPYPFFTIAKQSR